ncbi:MAG: type VI secretion system tube protein Hcp [Vicinamibacterales bacterium]|jgi:type VI secretion system secreted protein Hcp|nr:type VI secretion system tube protein Hcp [Vicinamibacterales bacterium]
MAQVDCFLKIEGVESESTDDKHKGEIEVESWSWGETQTGTAGHAGGQGAGKVAPQDMMISKRVDKGSPTLFIACATGHAFTKGTLTMRKAGEGQQEYLMINLEGILVSSYNVSGSGEGEIIPMEQLSLNFAKFEMSYKEQKADGSLGGEVKQGYDFAANVKL